MSINTNCPLCGAKLEDNEGRTYCPNCSRDMNEPTKEQKAKEIMESIEKEAGVRKNTSRTDQKL
jgi:uncharacterized Zn finger protein (UPF0148 family)